MSNIINEPPPKKKLVILLTDVKGHSGTSYSPNSAETTPLHLLYNFIYLFILKTWI